MSGTPSPTPLWLRGAGLLLGAILLFWLPIEDTSTRTPMLLATLVVILLAAYQIQRFAASPCRQLWVRHTLLGGLGGVGIPVLAAGLMILKSGIHSHGFPDYPLSQFFDVLSWSPTMLAAGVLLGLGAGAFRWWQCR